MASPPDGSGSLDLERIYEYRFRDVDQTARQGVWNVIARHIHKMMGSPESMLDPAAGRAEFLQGLPDVERWAVDIADHTSGESHETGIKFIYGDALSVELPESYFGGAFISNFLEHLQTHDDIALLLTRMLATLRSGGALTVMGPNYKYCATEYFDCADHVLALSHIAVEEHLYAAGFEVERVVPRFIPYSFRGLLPPSPTLTAAYLNMPFAWRLLGKQFLLIARKS